ncbi:MAG: GNAT family N-acetyltransferase [Betaproteobacteria bacterium]|nr:GNAT family N-acetyltransferase [Betaproteobacteria bacterium]
MTFRYAPLTAQDQPAVVQHLLSLDADDRVLRFNTTAPDEKVVEYCGRWNHADDIVEGAWEGERLIGLIHLPVFRVGADLVGELGVSVAADRRKRGVATRLALRTLDSSRRRGLDRIYINFLTRNRPMMCLARRFTDDIALDGDETVATIHLDAAPRNDADAADQSRPSGDGCGHRPCAAGRGPCAAGCSG